MNDFDFRKYFGNVWAFRTRENCEELAPTCSDPNFCKKLRKNCEKMRFFAKITVGTSLLPKLPKVTKKWCSTLLVSTRENFSRLKNRLESSVKSSECRALLVKQDTVMLVKLNSFVCAKCNELVHVRFAQKSWLNFPSCYLWKQRRAGKSN